MKIAACDESHNPPLLDTWKVLLSDGNVRLLPDTKRRFPKPGYTLPGRLLYRRACLSFNLHLNFFFCSSNKVMTDTAAKQETRMPATPIINTSAKKACVIISLTKSSSRTMALQLTFPQYYRSLPCSRTLSITWNSARKFGIRIQSAQVNRNPQAVNHGLSSQSYYRRLTSLRNPEQIAALRESQRETGFESLCGKRISQGDGMKLRCLILFF